MVRRPVGPLVLVPLAAVSALAGGSGVAAEEQVATAPARAAGAGRVLVYTGGSRPGRVDIHAGSGRVGLSGSDAARPLVSVRLSVDGAGATGAPPQLRAREAIGAAMLEAAERQGTLYLAVRYTPETAASLVREDWTVTLPRGTDAEVEMSSGRLLARGVDGRLDLRLGVGAIQVDTRGPGLLARVNYGDVTVRAESDSPGTLSAAAGTGRARIVLDGRTLPPRRALTGAMVSHEGGGRDDFRIRADVGDVVLRVTTPGAQQGNSDEGGD